MKTKLLVALFLSAVLAHAEWSYQQYPGNAMVSFYQEPAATRTLLNQARLALQNIDGVKSVYVKDGAVFVVKEPARSWNQLWDTIVTTISRVKPDVTETTRLEPPKSHRR